MRKGLTVLAMAIVSLGAPSCIELKQPQEQVQTEEFKWVVDTFDDIKVLQYKVPGFENLSLDQKKLIYYLNQAALSGRDIIFDQNFKYNLPIRRTLEAIYTNYRGDRTTAEWKAFEKYLKKVWFANGIHHHYSSDKFTPEFSEAYFDTLVASVPAEKLPHDFGSAEQLMAIIKPVIFDPALYPVRVNQAAGADLLKSSAMNYYDGVSQREAEAFYARMAKPGDPQPISYGLNSQLVKQNGKLTERVWKTDGMYAPALEKIVYWLEKAAEVASPVQKETIEALISFYNTGDLKEYDRFNILWVQDTASMVDFVNGFTEVYGDPPKKFLEKMNMIENEIKRVTSVIVPPKDANPLLEQYNSTAVKTGIRLSDMIKRPELDYEKLAPVDHNRLTLPDAVCEQVEIKLKYDGYIKRQIAQVEQFKKMEEKLLPENQDYSDIHGLRLEARQKLNKIQPKSLGQASRISGVSPSDMSVLIVWLESQKR